MSVFFFFFLPSNYKGGEGGGCSSWLSTKAWRPHLQGQRPPARLRLWGPASFPAPRNTSPAPHVFFPLWRPLGPHVHFYLISNTSRVRASRMLAHKLCPRPASPAGGRGAGAETGRQGWTLGTQHCSAARGLAILPSVCHGNTR